MKKKIAIIGSGVAGLALANLLRQSLNCEFVVYEKGDALNLNEGYGVQLSINSISILNRIGFDKCDKNKMYNPSKLDFYSTNLNKICDLDLTTFNSANTKYTTIKRSILINFLKEKLLTNSILFRKIINRVKQIDKKINIFFTDGTVEEVDYLIVSDGVFSSSKSIIENKVFKPIYSGAVAIRAQIKSRNIANFNSNNISIVMGSAAHSVLYPVNKSKEFNLVSIIRKKLKNSENLGEILESEFFRENKNLRSLFGADLKLWPIYKSSNPIKSNYKNVFYIGDAFYTFLPTMAQGTAQAIESANEIFKLIRNSENDIHNIYFKNRIKRTNLISKRSKLNYFGFHISNTILKLFRNTILKIIVKNKKFINSYLGKVYK
jgi:salicylate hydroxylase